MEKSMLKNILALSTVLCLSLASSYAICCEEVPPHDEFHFAACCESCECDGECECNDEALAECGCKKKPKNNEEKVASCCGDCGKKRTEDEFCCGEEEPKALCSVEGEVQAEQLCCGEDEPKALCSVEGEAQADQLCCGKDEPKALCSAEGEAQADQLCCGGDESKPELLCANEEENLLLAKKHKKHKVIGT